MSLAHYRTNNGRDVKRLRHEGDSSVAGQRSTPNDDFSDFHRQAHIVNELFLVRPNLPGRSEAVKLW
jgi:hypothetical protein